MKSFSQFLNESYLNEEEARQGSLMTRSGKPQDFRNPKKTPFTATDPTPTPASRRLSAGAPEAPKASSGQMDIDFNAKPNKGGALVKTSSSTPATKAGKLATTSSTKPATNPPIQAVNVKDITKKPKALPAAKSSVGKPPTTPPSGTSSAAKETQKAATKTAGKGILKTLGRVAGPAAAALDVADERSKGSGWARSLAKGAVVAAGGALGGAGGSVAGPVGTIGGATAGSMAASKAFDVAAGANAKERKAMATANRQKQAGSAVKGIGGKTTFDTKKNTITTGSGAQRKTVGLAKTGVVQRGGQSVAGNLAYKGGKAVYKAGPSAQSLAKTSSNPLERVGRSLFAGAYKKSDAANAAKKLATARASDAARNKALGVKSKPAG
jgi:hypothetical protein